MSAPRLVSRLNELDELNELEGVDATGAAGAVTGAASVRGCSTAPRPPSRRHRRLDRGSGRSAPEATAPAPFRRTIVDVLIVEEAIILVKMTPIGAVTLTPVAPPAGTVELTFGAVVSGGGTVSNTASTQ